MPAVVHNWNGAARTRTPLALIVAAALGVGLLAGVGGYLVGRSGGPSLQAAVLAGERLGLSEGAGAGRRLGYAAGLSQGYTSGYRHAFSLAYGAARRTAVRE